jgi:hypothetical protein
MRRTVFRSGEACVRWVRVTRQGKSRLAARGSLNSREIQIQTHSLTGCQHPLSDRDLMCFWLLNLTKQSKHKSIHRPHRSTLLSSQRKTGREVKRTGERATTLSRSPPAPPCPQKHGEVADILLSAHAWLVSLGFTVACAVRNLALLPGDSACAWLVLRTCWPDWMNLSDTVFTHMLDNRC